MSKVVIITDSTAYLPQQYIEQYGIRVIPLTLTWEGKNYRDGLDIQPDEFYEKMKTTSAIPTTSQLGVFDLERMFRSVLDEGNFVLGLFISSGISGSYQSALMAKENVKSDRVEIVDTRLVSMALGFQVLAAARAARLRLMTLGVLPQLLLRRVVEHAHLVLGRSLDILEPRHAGHGVLERQGRVHGERHGRGLGCRRAGRAVRRGSLPAWRGGRPPRPLPPAVSYTHLTLPTIYSA